MALQNHGISYATLQFVAFIHASDHGVDYSNQNYLACHQGEESILCRLYIASFLLLNLIKVFFARSNYFLIYGRSSLQQWIEVYK